MVMVMVMVMASAVRGAWEKMARASSEKRRSEKRRAVELTTCASSAASDSPFANLHLPPLRGDVQHVVPPDHAVAVLGLELPVDVLLRLLHRDVHEPIQTREDASVVHPGVELDHDGAPYTERRKSDGVCFAADSAAGGAASAAGAAGDAPSSAMACLCIRPSAP
eukprot:CAMPEP_0118887398 /NCGR_PEP_ID=MMETSP1163-20130328/25123_1 /TAXON_ID=124430 /ORGANISM="Phaeomonas parva, Strain CCMP2877" /LENGTH=164 /DNA_ID=CAMNT_0006825823 /DNA_START=97 /DNA_END=589 /DNA_ORIENTATION=+